MQLIVMHAYLTGTHHESSLSIRSIVHIDPQCNSLAPPRVLFVESARTAVYLQK